MLSHLDWFLGCEDWCRCIIAIYVHFSSFFLLSGLFAHPSDVLWALFLASQKSTEKRETKKVATNVKYWCSLAIRTYHSCAYRSIPIIGIPDTSSMPMPFHFIWYVCKCFFSYSNQISLRMFWFQNIKILEHSDICGHAHWSLWTTTKEWNRTKNHFNVRAKLNFAEWETMNSDKMMWSHRMLTILNGFARQVWADLVEINRILGAINRLWWSRSLFKSRVALNHLLLLKLVPWNNQK